jgi:glycosyltransferase involved in cell wall biosynthesis
MLGKPFVKTFFSVGTLGLGRLGNIPEHKIIDVPPPLGEHFKKKSPIDEDQLRLKLGLDVLLRKKVLLYHGVLHEQRGILEVLEVFVNSFKGDKQIALLIVGDGPAKNSVKNFIQNNKIKNIVFKGAVPYSNMPEIIAASDIGLVLLPDRPMWRYQCPTKLIELLAMGKPVIASDLPGIRWIAGNSPSVIYLKTLTISAFKEAINKALTKRDIKSSQEMIDKFSSYSIALRLSQVISTYCARNDC